MIVSSCVWINVYFWRLSLIVIHIDWASTLIKYKKFPFHQHEYLTVSSIYSEGQDQCTFFFRSLIIFHCSPGEDKENNVHWSWPTLYDRYSNDGKWKVFSTTRNQKELKNMLFNMAFLPYKNIEYLLQSKQPSFYLIWS
jgi:hypothetical protein